MLKTKSFFKVALAVSLAFGGSSVAFGGTTMNLGWAIPMDTHYGVFAKKFKELAEDYTNGEVEVKLRPSGQIGGEDEAFSALQLGTIDGYMITSSNVATHFPLLDVLSLPYIFTGPDHAYRVFDGEVGDSIKEKLYDETGVHLLSFNVFNYRDMYTTEQPIHSVKDMKGLKTRVPKNKVMIDTFKAFGVEPVPLAWSETPTALQTGTIDAADNGTEVILAMKFYEFAENLVILEHIGSNVPFFVSDRFMSRLSDENAGLVRKAAADAEVYQREVAGKKTEDIRKELSERGMNLMYPDTSGFIEAANKVKEEFVSDKGEEFGRLIGRIEEIGENK